jgi:hypothetical protein
MHASLKQPLWIYGIKLATTNSNTAAYSLLSATPHPVSKSSASQLSFQISECKSYTDGLNQLFLLFKLSKINRLRADCHYGMLHNIKKNLRSQEKCYPNKCKTLIAWWKILRIMSFLSYIHSYQRKLSY